MVDRPNWQSLSWLTNRRISQRLVAGEFPVNEEHRNHPGPVEVIHKPSSINATNGGLFITVQAVVMT